MYFNEQTDIYVSHNTLHQQSFLSGVFAWMGCALAVTALSSYVIVMYTTFFSYIQTHPYSLIGLIIAQFVLVIGLTFGLRKLSFIAALILFLLYAVTVGVTLSTLFYIYTTASIGITFFTTSGMFLSMALYGYYTHSDLTSIGSMSFMMLVGLIIGGVINLFMQSSTFDFILSGCGVIIFTLLTAYDVQKLKQLGQELISDNETMGKLTILGALTLYLDFINLFLYLLRFTGNRRQE